MSEARKARTIGIPFDEDMLVEIRVMADESSSTMSETVQTLVGIGLKELSNDFLGERMRSENERLLTLISDIYDFSRTPHGSLSIEGLDLLDQNISERIIAELHHEEINENA